MRKFISILTLTFILLTFITEEAKSSNFTIATYISKYRLIAQLESHRSGIPASIILAQAILESGYGNSDLCQRSKNHFGIKWKNAKDGDFVYSLDDDYDKDGKHIPSRFINYGNDLQSFHHHTDFLLSKDHYKPLFRLDRSDYINWAVSMLSGRNIPVNDLINNLNIFKEILSKFLEPEMYLYTQKYIFGLLKCLKY